MTGRRSQSGARAKILLAGVGGQGVIGAARILASAAAAAGVDVIAGELHGMSQRGGPVEASVVFGGARTAHVGPGEAAAVLAFEPIEALRVIDRAAPGAILVVACTRVPLPALARAGRSEPEADTVLSSIAARQPGLAAIVAIDPAPALRKLGEPRALAAAMLGALAVAWPLPLDAAQLRWAIQKAAPAGRREAWLDAHLIGRAQARAALLGALARSQP